MQFVEFSLVRADPNGSQVLAYGNLTVYLSGTETPAALFNSGGGSISNPVIADAAGLVGFAAANGTYDYVMQSSDGLYSLTIPKQQVFDLAAVANALAAGTLAGVISKIYSTQAGLFGDLAANANTLGLVYADPTASKNDLYVKLGASGSGSWQGPLGMGVSAAANADVANCAAYVASASGYATAASGYATAASNSAGAASGYATAASNAETGAQAAQAGTISAIAGAGGSIGTVILQAASMTLLKALDTTLGLAACLTLDGSIWTQINYAANSAVVTADTTNALYARSTYDTSIAWKRAIKVGEPWKLTWFGAIDNDIGSAGSDSYSAIMAAHDLAKGIRSTPWASGSIPALQTIDVDGFFYSSAAINLKTPIRWRWPSGGALFGGYNAWIRFPANTTGFIVNRANTTGYTAAATTFTTGADGTIFDNPVLQGGGGTYTNTADGIFLRARAQINNPLIFGFARHGIYVSAASGGSPYLGNANDSRIFGGTSGNNGAAGLWIEGQDANSIRIIALDTTGNGAWGKVCNQFLNATILGGDDTGNGVATYVCYPAAGQAYACRFGQETAASTTTPGTNSAVWWPISGVTGGYSTWVSGGTYRAGGAAYYGGITAVYNPYYEDGQGPAECGPSAFVDGGLADTVNVIGCRRYTSGGQTILQGGFTSDTRSWMQKELFFDGNHSTSFPGSLGGVFGGAVYWNTSDGLVGYGIGSTYDFNILNKVGSRVISVPTGTQRAEFGGPARLASFTVSGVPSASSNGAGSTIFVSNESGGATPAFSDGTNWRRVSDRAVIS